jgi:hypothetical protein
MFFPRLDSHDRRRLGYPTARMSPCGLRPHSSFISLREIPQPSALATMLERNHRVQFLSAQVAAGVSRSEIKEETAQRAGDIRGGSRPPLLVRGPNTKQAARRSKKWAS